MYSYRSNKVVSLPEQVFSSSPFSLYLCDVSNLVSTYFEMPCQYIFITTKCKWFLIISSIYCWSHLRVGKDMYFVNIVIQGNGHCCCCREVWIGLHWFTCSNFEFNTFIWHYLTWKETYSFSAGWSSGPLKQCTIRHIRRGNYGQKCLVLWTSKFCRQHNNRRKK